MYTIKELSEMSGIACHTLRDRLRRGYTIEQAVKPSPIHDSIEEFSNASHWEDWLGMPINSLYEVYWKWCIAHEYQPIAKQGFSRQLFTLHPQLKTVPTSKGVQCNRIIRVKHIGR